MEKTPLEIYETAYKLHYTEHRIADAVVYYQRLIKEFPDANECGYAAIQLQKIKASEVASDLNSLINEGKRKHGAIPTLLVLCLFALAACGFFIYKLNQKIAVEQQRAILAENALSKFSRGNHEDALALLSELKMLKLDDIMPYELSADIYRADKRYDKARKEYTTFFQLNPTLRPSENEEWFMDFAEGKKGSAKKEKTVVAAQDSPSVPPPAPASKRKTTRSKRKKRRVPPPPGKKKNGGLFLVDPDSISYF